MQNCKSCPTSRTELYWNQCWGFQLGRLLSIFQVEILGIDFNKFQSCWWDRSCSSAWKYEMKIVLHNVNDVPYQKLEVPWSFAFLFRVRPIIDSNVIYIYVKLFPFHIFMQNCNSCPTSRTELYWNQCWGFRLGLLHDGKPIFFLWFGQCATLAQWFWNGGDHDRRKKKNHPTWFTDLVSYVLWKKSGIILSGEFSAGQAN